MTTKISTANIQPVTLAALAGGGGPKISQIVVANSSYESLDDTAVALEGGYIKLIGSGFEAGCQVLVGLTPATSVTFISDTEVRAQVPATAAGTYIIYLVNADGGTAIRINGITFSGTPTWTSDSTLVGVVDTAISIQLTATDATTFALAAGSTLPPGVTLSSSGLLSGTVTGIQQETVYNFTINAVDSELQDSPRSFAFTVTSGDPYFNLTTLLLPGSATTFVKDASSNNFAVTVAGDTRPNTFNPYLSGWSNYFDGNGDYLSVADNPSLDGFTGDFTIEFWVNYSSTEAGVALSKGWNGGSFSPYLFLLSSGSLALFASSGGGWDISSGQTIVSSIITNTWYHIAISRSGSSLRLFANGVLSATITTSATFMNSSDALTVGSSAGGFTPMTGYVSNVRIVAGTALYTANFTPSTTPLTAIAGTSLLTCQSNRFIDNSVNNFVITRTGDVAVQSFSPFLEPQTTGGSGYFDGNGDYLTVAENTALDFGTGDFTVEAWVYPISTDKFHPTFVGSVTGWSAGASGHRFNNINYANKFWFGLNGSGGIASGDPFLVSTNTFSFNTWHHYALTRSGNTFRMFVNGVLENTQTYSGPYNAGLGGLRSGWSTWDGSNGYWTGSVSNLRLVKGTALYTADFTPPTEPLTAVAGTSLLTLQSNQPANNHSFLDSSSNNLLVTRNGNATQGTFSPYSPSGWSNYFDGTGDYLTVPNNAALAFGSGDFCLEFWIYTTAFGGTDGRPLGNHNGWGANAWSLHNDHGTANEKYTFWVHNYSSDSPMFTSSSSVGLNTWTHVAVTRSGSSWRMFVNGVQEGSTVTSSAALDGGSSDDMYIGGSGGGSEYVTGYMSNVRVVKGTAVYTANFTPPTQPLTAIAGTSLLTCQSSGFADLSSNRSAITRNGDVRVTNFAPFKAVVQTPTTYSAYFDGTGDYLSISGNNTAFAMGTGDFTYEAWIYPISIPTYSQIIAQFSTLSSGQGSFAIPLTTDRQIELYYDGQSYTRFTSATVTLNTWNHVAIVRSGSTITGYINGVVAGTVTYSGIFGNSSNNLEIGATTRTGSAAQFVHGYISNVRIVKGTALYTAAFTPPTQPLTAIANTSLLTCQSATFVDNSANSFAITAAGNTQPTIVNPFGSTFTNSTGYTAAEYSGSMYFDGSGDFLTLPANNSFATGTGDFTIEGWIYVTDLSATRCICGTRTNADTTTGWNLAVLTNGSIQMWDNTAYANTGAGSVVVNTWNHFAFVRQSNIIYSYVNGIQRASTANTRNWTQNTFWIGANGGSNEPFAGYMNDIRFIKGQALYTSNFVPPAAPVEPVANTVLLLNGTAAAVTDATTRNVVETVGTAGISTAVAKFDGSSMNFASGENLLKILNSDAGVFGTGDFTVEMWAYFPVDLESIGRLIAFTNSADPGAGRLQQNSGNTLYWINASGATGTSIAVSLNTWTHIAVCRSGTTIRYFKDGVQVGSGTDSSNYTVRDIYVASDHSGSWRLTCSIQDLRITKHARYTANFTPPSRALQTR